MAGNLTLLPGARVLAGNLRELHGAWVAAAACNLKGCRALGL